MDSKKVLLLGSGLVTRPAVEVMTKAGISVTVASRSLENARKLAKGFDKTTAISLNVDDSAALDEQVSKHDLVVSLIPYSHHVTVIKSAIKNKKDVVTTSYISPGIAELEQQVKDAGITVMNEIGLDPGIDHLYAIKTIDEVHREGGKINSFLSYCGGLPSPEASDNPFGVKFSWSPKGFLMTAKNDAKFYKDGKVEETQGKDVMRNAQEYDILPAFAFYAFPNRDSSIYKERYSIPEAHTIVRGSLRYKGYTQLMRTLVDMGFISQDENPKLKKAIPWNEATKEIIGASSSSEKDLISKIESLTTIGSEAERERIVAGLQWIGLFSDTPIEPRGTPIDVLCANLESKMSYGPGERDMVMLQHKFEIEHKDGSREIRTSSLLDYGDPNGYSSMARLVGVPCGVAVKQVLNGTIKGPGILAPMSMDICEPLMKELKDSYGISCVEKTVRRW